MGLVMGLLMGGEAGGLNEWAGFLCVLMNFGLSSLEISDSTRLGMAADWVGIFYGSGFVRYP